jgi:CheY-like chemotaxis protein
MKTTPRILIVEDNPDDEALLMRQLKKAELHEHVKAIHDGAKALSYLTDERNPAENLAALFLDLQLPKLSGLQLLEAIRSDERIQHIPIIVMTSSNDPKDLEKCRELGVSCFVQKPLTFTSFAKAFADTFQAQREAGFIQPLASTYE